LYVTIGGGTGNSATATNATIPGGASASAASYGQFAYASVVSHKQLELFFLIF